MVLPHFVPFIFDLVRMCFHLCHVDICSIPGVEVAGHPGSADRHVNRAVDPGGRCRDGEWRRGTDDVCSNGWSWPGVSIDRGGGAHRGHLAGGNGSGNDDGRGGTATTQSPPSSVDPVAVAQDRVDTAEAGVSAAEKTLAAAREGFCGTAKDYVETLNRYGYVFTDATATVGDVQTLGADLVGTSGRGCDGRRYGSNGQQ